MGKGADFLREAGVYFIATSHEGQPELRPFGSNMEYQGKFYFSMGKSKKVFQQITSNPKISISAMKVNRDWIRIYGKAVLDESEEARNHCFDQAPRIKVMYQGNLSECGFFYLEEALCLVYEAGKDPVEVDL
ncbi:MAG: pyridoxamine 5'-phosphate oxidase family protein [Treponema sp.]|nr:pyridoxamine 5'-phosphate oxidase family protein [Treponema sp.]